MIADFAREGALDVEIFHAIGAYAVDEKVVVLALETDEAVHAAFAFEVDGGVFGVVNADGGAAFIGPDEAGVGEELVVVGFFVIVAGDGDADASVVDVDVAIIGDFAGSDVFLAVEDADAFGVFHGDNVFVHKGFVGGAGIIGHGAALAHGDDAVVEGLAVGVDAHAFGGGGGSAVHEDAAVVGEGEVGAGFAAHAFGVAAFFGGFHPDVAVVFGVGIVGVGIDDGGSIGAGSHAPGNAGLIFGEVVGGFGRADVGAAADHEVGIGGDGVVEQVAYGHGRAGDACKEQGGSGEGAERIDDAAFLQHRGVAVDEIAESAFGRHDEEASMQFSSEVASLADAFPNPGEGRFRSIFRAQTGSAQV